jgi:Protein of unknown function (DUF1579)
MTRSRLAVLLLLSAVWSAARGDDKPAWGDQGKPGPEHERLRALVGKWELSAAGTKDKGTAEYKSILGGRFVTEEVKLPLAGFTIEWLGVYGYDRQKKKYTAVWVDSLDTTTEAAQGDADASGKVLTFTGEHADPRTGKPSRFTWRLTRDDKGISIEMLEGEPPGKQLKVMTVRGVRIR